METCLLSLETCACMNWRCGYIDGSLELAHIRLISVNVSRVTGDGKGMHGDLVELNLKLDGSLLARHWWL